MAAVAHSPACLLRSLANRLLACCHSLTTRLLAVAVQVFVRPLSALPNTIAVCKEARRAILLGLEVGEGVGVDRVVEWVGGWVVE